MKIIKIKNLKLKTRKILSIILVVLIVLSSIKFLFLKPKDVFADSTLGFNEGYGSTVYDNNSNVTGTITNAVWKQEDLCKVGKCLYFDGTGDLINFGDDADFDHVAADNFTIEGWFRTPDITSGTRVLVSKYNSTTSTDGGYKVYMDSNGYLIFGIDDDQTSFPEDSTSSSTKSFDDNKWHYFAAVKTGTTSITLYVDGNQYQIDSSISATGTLANTDTFYIGIDGDGSTNGFSGFLDEIKIYNTARSSVEIKTDIAGITPSRGVAASFGPDQSHLSDGLVGYWKMDEASDATRADYSGNSNTLTESSLDTVAQTSGKYGYSGDFEFDDTESISITDASQRGLDITGNITLCSWIKPESFAAAAMGVVGKWTSGASSYYLSVASNETVDFSVYSGITGSSVSSEIGSVTVGNWVHICGVYDGKNIISYVNGVPSGDGPIPYSSGIANTSAAFTIGTANDTDYFDGLIEEVRIYNRALSSIELSQLYNFAPGPIMNWSLDEGNWTNDCSTVSVFDRSGNGNNGTACPTTTGPTGGSSGKFGKAGIFDGSEDYINIPTFSGLPSGSGAIWTLSAWVKTTTINGNNHVIISYGDGQTTGASPHIALSDTNKWRVSTWGTGTSIDSNATPVTNTWTHIAGTSDGTTLRLYVNGVLDNQGAPASNSPLTTNLRIGSSPRTTPTIFWSGTIDDVKIYNYARTQSQIIEDMNGGHPAPGSPIGSAVAKWKMDEGYTTTAHDSSINANDLALSTASWTNSGKFGKAFNGLSNVRMSRADDADLDFAASDDATFSLWFKSDSATNPSANEYLLEKGGNITTDAIGYAIYTSSASDGLICFGIDDDATSFPEDSVCSSSDLYDNTWHHIVAKKTGTSRLDLYVDGKANGTPDTSISATGTLANASTFYIGDTNGTDGTDEFLGDIDEVQIYRSALTAESIISVFNQGSGTSLGSFSTDSSNDASNSDTDSYCPPGQGSTCTPPVGEWKLDENTSLTAFDTGTSGNNGTISTTNNTPRWSPGVFGSGLRFPGTTGADAVSMGDPANLDFGTNSFTLQYWMKVDGTTGTTQIPIYKGGPSSTTVGYDVEINSSNVLKWHYGDGTAPNYVSINISDDISPYFGKWVFITCVVDRTNNISSVYFNGRFVTSASIAGYGSVDNTRNFQLGNYHSGTLPFYGSLDEIKVYNYARTSAQIAWDMNHGAPVGWWKLDENTGTAANDSAGSSTAGTLTNTPTWATGKFNAGVTFAGSNQQIIIADDSDFDFIDDENMSVTGWLKHTTASVQEIILSKYAAAGYKVISESDGDITCGLDYDATWTPTDSATSTLATYDDNSWHHFACVKNGATSLSLYIDGVLITTDSSLTASNSLDNADPLYLGIDADGTSNDYTGSLDDIRIYRYPLTVQQIKTIMNNGAAVKY